MTNPINRKVLMTALCAGTILTTGQVQAQSVAPSTAQTGDIVVTGFRASQKSAIEAKRRAPVILDAISQDDVGRLPDLNIVEASRRIAGVSVVGGADATKNRDIYQRATIRGLDPRYNLVTIDGVPLASPDWIYRGARLEMLPSSLVSRIEAIKAVSAQYDPHALGGQINIVSKSAFDQRQNSLFILNTSGGYNDTAGKLIRKGGASVRADATGALRFGAGEQFGLVASAEYQRLPSTARAELPGDSAGAGWSYYTAAGAKSATPEGSTGSLVPIRNQDYFFENMRTRLSGNLKLEWRPSDRAEVSVFGGYYHDKDTETRYETLVTPTGSPSNVTATSGSFAQGDLQQGLTYQPVRRDTYMFNAKGHYAFNDKVVLDATLSHSKAIYRELREMIKYDTNPRAGSATALYLPAYGYTYSIANGAPRLTLNDVSAANNPDSYKALYYRSIQRNMDSTVDYAKLNLGINSGAQDRGLGLNAGVAITGTGLSYDQIYQEWVPGTTAGQSAIGTLSGILYAQRPATYELNGVNYLLIDRAAAWARFAANSGNFIATNQIANNAADDFHDHEVTKAAYVQALYRGEKFDVQAGMRYDRTDLTIDTWQAPTISGSTAYEAVRRKTSYDFLLPSALATWSIADGMRLRVGVSKTIGRPDYSQYAARTSFGVGTNGTLAINTGNPDLKPREAWNYDLSYEWYMGRAGMLSVAGFIKEIRNEIFTSSAAGAPATYAGVTYDSVTVSTPRNAARASVKGIDVSYSRDQFFIPGLGLNANLTLLDGGFDQPMSTTAISVGTPAIRRTSGLIQQPDYIANATLFYTAGAFELRGSYNRIGKALQSVDADSSTRDLYQAPRQQLDLQARYSLRAGVDIVGQIQNLTKEPFIVRQGVGQAFVNYYFPVGRTFWLGISWKPKA